MEVSDPPAPPFGSPPLRGLRLLISLPIELGYKSLNHMARKILANTFLSRPCRAAGREAWEHVRDVGLVRDGPASWLLAPSSEVPLQERRVSESESVSAVTRRDCRDHFGCSVPILLRAPHTIHQYPLASSFPGRRSRGGARVYLPTNLSVVPVGKRWVAGAMTAHVALNLLRN